MYQACILNVVLADISQNDIGTFNMYNLTLCMYISFAGLSQEISWVWKNGAFKESCKFKKNEVKIYTT